APENSYWFDVVAIDNIPGEPPAVRLYKDAFGAQMQQGIAGTPSQRRWTRYNLKPISGPCGAARNTFEEDGIAGVAERPDHGPMGNHFDGARKTAERISARKRGRHGCKELSVLRWE